MAQEMLEIVIETQPFLCLSIRYCPGDKDTFKNEIILVLSQNLKIS